MDRKREEGDWGVWRGGRRLKGVVAPPPRPWAGLLALHPGSTGCSTPAEAPSGHLGKKHPSARLPLPKSKPGAERARFGVVKPTATLGQLPAKRQPRHPNRQQRQHRRLGNLCTIQVLNRNIVNRIGILCRLKINAT